MSKLQHDQVPDLLLHSIGDPLWCIGRARFVGPTRRRALHTLHICSLKAMIRPGWTSSKSQVDGIEWSRDVRNPPKVRRFRGRSCGRGPFARWDENNGCLGHASLTRKDPSSSHPATLILTTPPPVVSFSHVDDAEQRGRNPYSTEPLWLNREQGNFVDSTTVMSQNALRTCQAVNLLLVSLLLQRKE